MTKLTADEAEQIQSTVNDLNLIVENLNRAMVAAFFLVADYKALLVTPREVVGDRIGPLSDKLLELNELIGKVQL